MSEIDDDALGARLERGGERLAQVRRRVVVDLALDGHDSRGTHLTGGELDVHVRCRPVDSLSPLDQALGRVTVRMDHRDVSRSVPEAGDAASPFDARTEVGRALAAVDWAGTDLGP